MKKLTVVLAVVLLFWTGHADALGLSADVAYFSLVESEYQIEEMTSVGGGVTLLDLGTAELALTGRLIGDPTGLGELARVYLKRPAADPLEDAVLVVGDILVSLKTELPLTPDIRVAAQAGIGDISYLGGLAGEEPAYNVYRGVRIGAGIRRKITLTASLFASMEYGPHMVHVFGTHESSAASWAAAEAGVQFNVPFGFVKGGVRMNSLRESHDSQRFTGVFLSGGIGF